jgi:hypothetical protein
MQELGYLGNGAPPRLFLNGCRSGPSDLASAALAV